jgi:ceramide glucosyltransferase
MFHYAVRLAELIAVLGTFSSLAYYIVCIWSASRFLRHRGRDVAAPTSAPPVSILKPLKGTDPGMYEAFRSYCLQNYPNYEIIFGVSDPADPAVELVERLKKEFPEHSVRLVVCSEILGTNVKVSNLLLMVKQARHDFLIVNDSDILVPPDYLARLTRALFEPQVGLVTCLYRGKAANTLGSRLEALGISTDFSPGVLVAQELEGGLGFGLGSTLAFRRSDLESIGGFESILEYIADDYQLGARMAQRGLRVKLSDVVVETLLPAYSFRDFLEHQLRWGRTIRDSRPWGYLGLVTTFGLPWALLAVLLVKGALWTWLLFAVTVALRMSMAFVVGERVIRDKEVVPRLWLLPLRDLLAVFVWIRSFFGNTVRWRGDVFRLEEGKLVKISE